MARSNMNFSATLRLNSKEFKKGIKDVQNSLKGLQRTFVGIAGALGAGLGLTQLISNLKSTAVELSVAKATLENVSHVTKTYTDGVNTMSVSISNYEENLKFVKDLSNKYAQDMVALTSSFAQFHAACDNTNISLEEQKNIFESLTRAATYYHMSADKVKDMQTAIVQMASKGRVTAEELRRQLGNSLPGAFNLMAAALGVTTAELDDMMKKGKVASEDALPKFAAMLNTVTKNLNMDSLQLSMNRLKNAWTEMVDNANFEGVYNNMVKGATGVLKFFTDSFWPKVLGIGVGIGGAFGFKWLKNYLARVRVEVDAAANDFNNLSEEIKVLGEKANLGKYIQAGAARGEYRYAGTTYGGKNGLKAIYPPLSLGPSASKLPTDEYEKLAGVLADYNDELLKFSELQKKATGKPIFNSKDIKGIQNLNSGLRATANASKAVADDFDELNSKATLTSTVMGRLGTALKKFGIMVKAALANLAVGAAIGIIVTLISKQIEYNKKLKEAKDIYNQYLKDMKATDEGVAENAAILKSNLRVLQDTSRSEAARISALKKINELTGSKYSTELIKQKDAINEANKALGKTQDAYKDIVDMVDKWIEATKLQAKIQVQANRQAQAQGEIDRLEAENKEISDKIWNPKNKWEQFQRVSLRKRFNLNDTAIQEYKKVVSATEKELDALGVKLVEIQAEMNQPPNDDEKNKTAKGIQKTFEDWKEETKKLENLLKEGVITKRKYDEDLDELISKTWTEAAGSGKLSLSDITKKLQSGKALTEMEKWYLNLANQSREIAQRIVERSIEDITDEIDKELDAAFLEELKKIKEGQEKVAEELGKIKLPKFNAPDTWDNYKQEDFEIWEENAESIKDYVDELKSLRDTMQELKNEYGDLGVKGEIAFEQLNKAIATLGATANNLRDKARVEEWKKDIKDLQEQFNSGLYNSIKNVAQGFERLYDTFKDLSEKMEDAEGIEGVILAFETLFDVLETGMAIYEGIKSLTEISAKLQKAQASEEMLNLEKQIAAKTALATADATEGTAAVTAEAAKAAAVKATTAAMKEAAVAAGTNSAMMLPYPANLAALAQNLAAITAAFTSAKALQHFANGGIVGGGSKTGDHTLIRANAGELVMNGAQQRDLWNFIKNGSQGNLGGQVQFKIRGTDLIGAIKNTERVRKG